MQRFIICVFAVSWFALLAACAAPAQPATSVSSATAAPNAPTALPSPNSARLSTPTAPNAATSTTANFPTPPPNVQAKLGETFVLHVSQTAILTDTPDQFGITFQNVAQDSRCPEGVACVWAGEVRVKLTFQERGMPHPPILELTTTPNAEQHIIRVEAYLVELVKVEPPRVQGAPIAPNEYVATFRVTNAPATPTPLPNVVTGALDQPLTMKMFQVAEFPQASLRVTMNGLLEESRCPRTVKCIQAGRAVLSFMLERNERLGFFELSTSPPDGSQRAYFQGYALELLGVEPYPETPQDNIPVAKYLATIVVRKMAPPQVAHQNEGFALKIGQTAQIADENVQVKFVSVGKDSRCPYGVMCAVQGNAAVEVTLTEANGTESKFILNTHDSQNNQRIPDSGLYGMELLALTPYPRVDIAQKITPAEYQAILVVHKFAAPQQLSTKTPTVLSPKDCLGLTQQDAEAILGQAMQTVPQAHVPIKIPMAKEFGASAPGLCGYVSVSKDTRDVVMMNEPHLESFAFEAAMTAGRVTGANILELARIASIVRYANSDADDNEYLILQTRLVAGDWDGIFESFQKLGAHSPDVHFENVDRFGDEGLWIWRAGIIHDYAVLLVRDGDVFVVLEALLPKRINEAAAKESIHAVAGKMW